MLSAASPTLVSALGHASRPGALSVVRSPSATATAILFPGDLSTTRSAMHRDPQLSPFSAWSVEDLAVGLAARFPTCHAVVVHPPRNVNGFSCYDGFLTQLNETGDPLDGCYHGEGTCCSHIMALLRQAEERCPGVSSAPLHLLGFSKGGVVLNQCLAELGADVEHAAPRELLEATASFTWLDPGLNRPGPILLADVESLRRAARRLLARSTAPPRLAVALTPYQLRREGWLQAPTFLKRWLPPSWTVCDTVSRPQPLPRDREHLAVASANRRSRALTRRARLVPPSATFSTF
eukprot:2437361-Prymnesium_polylepis.1